MSRCHYVYVLRDAADSVLYVGCTSEVSRRLSRHRLRPWGPRVARIEMYPYDDRAEATSVETELIVELEPEFNVDDALAEPAEPGARLEQLRQVFRQGPMTQHEARDALRLAGADKLHSWFGMALNRLRDTGELVAVGVAEVPDRKYDPNLYALATIAAHQRRAGELAAEQAAS